MKITYDINGLIHHIDNGDYRTSFQYIRTYELISISHCYKNQLHKESGPTSIIYKSTGEIRNERYYINGEIHREDGPAHIEDNKKYYYLNNTYFPKQTFITMVLNQIFFDLCIDYAIYMDTQSYIIINTINNEQIINCQEDKLEDIILELINDNL